MYAVFVTGGRQFRAVPGEVIRVEKLEVEPGSTVTLDQVLDVVERMPLDDEQKRKLRATIRRWEKAIGDGHHAAVV